jgi:hypothetical protein
MAKRKIILWILFLVPALLGWVVFLIALKLVVGNVLSGSGFSPPHWS